jgi:hypothetical protein
MKLFKKDIGHLRVIVLPGMDKYLGMVFSQLTGERCTLDKLWPGSHNGNNLHNKNPWFSKYFSPERMLILVPSSNPLVYESYPDKCVWIDYISTVNDDRMHLP